MFKNSIETKINIESNTKSIWQELINFEEYKNWNPAIYEVSGVLNEGEILKIVVKINGSTMVFKPKILKYNVKCISFSLHYFQICSQRYFQP